MRPKKDEYARGYFLIAVKFIDAVVRFDKLTPLRLIEAIRPKFSSQGLRLHA